jgi:hypothetical protein
MKRTTTPRINGIAIHLGDLKEAKVGRRYFVVQEGRCYRKPNNPPTSGRLQTLPPKRLGVIRGLVGSPIIRRDLLGLVEVRRRGGRKVLEQLDAEALSQAVRDASGAARGIETRLAAAEGSSAR